MIKLDILLKNWYFCKEEQNSSSWWTNQKIKDIIDVEEIKKLWLNWRKIWKEQKYLLLQNINIFDNWEEFLKLAESILREFSREIRRIENFEEINKEDEKNKLLNILKNIEKWINYFEKDYIERIYIWNIQKIEKFKNLLENKKISNENKLTQLTPEEVYQKFINWDRLIFEYKSRLLNYKNLSIDEFKAFYEGSLIKFKKYFINWEENKPQVIQLYKKSLEKYKLLKSNDTKKENNLETDIFKDDEIYETLSSIIKILEWDKLWEYNLILQKLINWDTIRNDNEKLLLLEQKNLTKEQFLLFFNKYKKFLWSNTKKFIEQDNINFWRKYFENLLSEYNRLNINDEIIKKNILLYKEFLEQEKPETKDVPQFRKKPVKNKRSDSNKKTPKKISIRKTKPKPVIPSEKEKIELKNNKSDYEIMMNFLKLWSKHYKKAIELLDKYNTNDLKFNKIQDILFKLRYKEILKYYKNKKFNTFLEKDNLKILKIYDLQFKKYKVWLEEPEKEMHRKLIKQIQMLEKRWVKEYI